MKRLGTLQIQKIKATKYKIRIFQIQPFNIDLIVLGKDAEKYVYFKIHQCG